ncbi:MAG TPA: type IV secretion system protein [Gallionella sp.]|nr:type IV secretion system protein [Gallionella sp.]
MQTKRIVATLSLLAVLASSDSFAAGIPVFDGVTAANFVQTLANDATKISALQSQLQSMQQQIAMNTGSRGMGALSFSNASSGFGGVLQQVKNASGNYGQLIGNVIANQAVLTAQQKTGKLSPAQQEIFARLWQIGAIQKVMADLTTTTAARQLTEIQALSSRIDTANDPKAVADLNAAISVKKLELDNTRLQLYAMEQQMQAEQKLIEQRQRELAMERLGSSSNAQVRLR